MEQMVQTDPRERLKAIFEGLSSKNTQLKEAGFDAFYEDMQDENNLRVVYEGLTKNNPQLKEVGFDGFRDDVMDQQTAEPLKKKDLSGSPGGIGSQASSPEVNELEEQLKVAAKNRIAGPPTAQQKQVADFKRLLTKQKPDVDAQSKLINDLNLKPEQLEKLNQELSGYAFPDGTPVTWQELPAEELSKMLVGKSVKEIDREAELKTSQYGDIVNKAQTINREELEKNYSGYNERTRPQQEKAQQQQAQYEAEAQAEADFDKNKERNPLVSGAKSLWGVMRYDIPSAALSLTAAQISESSTGGGQFSGIGDQIRDMREGKNPTEELKRRNLKKKLNLILQAESIQNQGAEYKKDLVNKLDKIQDPIDGLNWVFSALGQATGQIPLTIATGGGSSFVQEVGSIYMDGLRKLSEESGKSFDQIIQDGDDQSLAPLVFGISAALLDRVGAKGVKDAFNEKEIFKAFQERALLVSKAGGREGGTEFIQTGLEDIGASQMAGKTWGESFAEMDWSEMVEAGAQGIVGGSGLVAMGQGVNKATDVAQSIRNKVGGERSFAEAKAAEPAQKPVDPNSAESVVPPHQLAPAENKVPQEPVAEPPATPSKPEPMPASTPEQGETEYKYKDVSDPSELADLYTNEVTSPTIEPKKVAIAEILGSVRVLQSSILETVGDKNNLSNNMAKSYIGVKKGTSIDQVAQDASLLLNPEGDGTEISPDDVWEFMKDHPGGSASIFQPNGNPVLSKINARYKELTGKSLNKRTASLISKKKKQVAADDITPEVNEALTGDAKFMYALDMIDKNGITPDNFQNPEVQELLSNDFLFDGDDLKNIQIIFEYGSTEEGRKRIDQIRADSGLRLDDPDGGRSSIPGVPGETTEGTGIPGESIPDGTSDPGPKIDPDKGYPADWGQTPQQSPKKRKKPTVASTKKKLVDMQSKIAKATPEDKAKHERLHKRYKDLTSKTYEGEQASADKFYEPPVGSPKVRRKVKTVRTNVAPIYGGKVKLLRDIMVDLSKSIPNPVFYTKSPIKGRRSIGSYNPGNAAIAIKYKGDLDVTAHELGHALDDRFGFLRGIAQTGKSAIEKELKQLSQWGSKPPKGHPNPQNYQYGEGVAEFIRAYLVNPNEAAQVYPELTAHLKKMVPDATIKTIDAFGTDIRTFAGLSAHDQVMSNTQFDPEKKKGGLASFFKPSATSKDNFQITWMDRLSNKFLNDKTYFEKSVKWLKEVTGTNVDASKDPVLLAKLLMGANEKIDNIFREGLVNKRNKRILDPVSRKRMNFEWLLQPFDATDPASLLKEQQEAISYMVAQRTMELSARFGRADLLTGIGAGIFKDVQVASQRIAEFKGYSKAKQERIEEGVRRYREYADRVLQYMVDKGRMSEAQYDQIKADNTQYVALSRILEVAPGEEIVVYKSTKGGKALGSTSKIVHSIKGSSALIKNPYESLVEITARSIRESDRNEAMLAFRELFKQNRSMGQGEPVLTADIARPATSKDKNVVQIFYNGASEYWQLDPDVYRSVKGLFDTAYTLPIVLTALPQLLRWSVTNFPVFAARNKVRDTQQRFVVSNTNAYKGYDIYFDKKLKNNARDMFQLFGGGQAGYYLMNDNFYYQMMDQAVAKMTKQSNTIMSLPGKMWDGYQKFLSGAERSTRLEEYRSSFKKAKDQGMDDYNAMVYAAYQSRDLLDFSVAGEWMRVINQMVPFSNAAIQGLRKTIRSGKENPAGFAIRFALFAVIPTMLTRLVVHALGDDEEYENLPDYRRDLFYNIPVGQNLWISIPKAFEIGVMASGIERIMSKFVFDQDSAMDGYAASVGRSLMPVDDAAVAGGYRPIVEILTNHDFFRDKYIIPPDELKLNLEYRNTDKASRIGKLFQGMIGVDGRQIDYFVKSSGSYYGDFALRISDIGRGDSRYTFSMAQTGFFKNDPVYESKDVQWVYKFAEENGVHWSDPFYGELKALMSDYFNSPPELKDKAGKEVREMARQIKSAWDTDDFREELANSREPY